MPNSAPTTTPPLLLDAKAAPLEGMFRLSDEPAEIAHAALELGHVHLLPIDDIRPAQEVS